jgi:hypothetical protein
MPHNFYSFIQGNKRSEVKLKVFIASNFNGVHPSVHMIFLPCIPLIFRAPFFKKSLQQFLKLCCLSKSLNLFKVFPTNFYSLKNQHEHEQNRIINSADTM